MVTAATTAPSIRARVERSAPDAVFEWRFDELERAGVDAIEAVRLAIDVTFDIGRLRDLVARGCDAALAVTILR
ncbi:MAG: hypothetical protein LH654_15720 [Thermoleophilia bacterium]|nr:hypothetical protein [Thermoleophilia bacterium]